MTDPSTIFQRTHAGREEIHEKSHGLTQSERLVLIMVDGVSSYKEIRAKLPVLTDERFERALHKLQLKELVLEVFMPLEGQTPDELERTVIDRFLQQDPMDPLTVILRDPEDELGMLSQRHKPTSSSTSMQLHTESAPTESAIQTQNVERTPSQITSHAAGHEDIPTLVVPSPIPSPVVKSEPALDAQDVLLADALSAELKAKWAARPAHAMSRAEAVSVPDSTMGQSPQELSPFVAVHWGYWLIVSGLSFIVGYVLARMTS